MTDRSVEEIVAEAFSANFLDGGDGRASTISGSFIMEAIGTVVCDALRQAGLLLDPGEWEQQHDAWVHRGEIVHVEGVPFGCSYHDGDAYLFASEAPLWPDDEPLYRRRPQVPSKRSFERDADE